MGRIDAHLSFFEIWAGKAKTERRKSMVNNFFGSSMVQLIVKKDLPLAPERLAEVNKFCAEQVDAQNFKVLGQIPEVLRIDWLDESLEEAVRANKHTNVESAVWRAAMESMCDKTVETYLQEYGKHRKTIALLMWRAALAYLKSLATHGIRPCHIDVKRNEATLKIIEVLSLNEDDKELFRSLGKDGRVFLPDPMLASGSSMYYAIDMLKNLGVENNQITIGCVVAAPEGVFNLLNQFPGIKIIAATMDGCLNGNAYIVDKGLGDAGEKYFCGNAPKNFARGMFTDEQWRYLLDLLEMTNK